MAFQFRDYDNAKTFYLKTLAPLGYTLVMEVTPPQFHARAAGLGKSGKPDLWISEEGQTTPHIHIAIVADSRAAVDSFHKAGLEAGGRYNGAPGIRAHYHPNYYGAFIFGPDGHNIEAVSHGLE